ncbi:thermonuclease family protein [Agrobacterium salinitolerans]|uniref:thermonuclease family protein n=1 Tax=Agrobacterium salinitolerans TaxID=1183413 RepID=UPI0030B8C42B
MGKILAGVLVLTGCAIFASSPALSQSVACASLVVIDGDTIKCDGQNMRLLGGGVPFKSGVDAPEIGSRAKCEFERDLALRAKARLKELLLNGVPRIEDSGARDRTRSRRPLVNIYLPDGREAGQVLMSEGFAKPWHPKRRIDWCSGTAL